MNKHSIESSVPNTFLRLSRNREATKSHLLSARNHFIFFCVCLVGIACLQPLRAESIQYPIDPGVVDVTKPPYSADRTGGTDVTAILQQAISDHVDTRKIIYLPNGTYKVSETLKWVNNSGAWKAYLQIQGQSRAGTIIRLSDNIPLFGGTNPAKAVIMTGSRDNQNPPGGGNEAFKNSLRNLTIHTGSGNSKAIAVDYQVSNQGAIKDVTIKSGDGSGYCGIALTRGWPGPGLVKNVSIEGFDYGVRLGHADYSMTFEHLTLLNQNINGIYCDANTINVRKLTSTNTVPAIRMLVNGSHLTLLDSTLSTGGTTSSSAAIVLQGIAYVRNTSVSGYAKALDSLNSNNRDVPMTGTPTLIGEYFALDPNKAFSSTPSAALDLPVEETPTYTDGPVSDWANAASYGATNGGTNDDTAAIQNALNSGKATVYLPYGTYNITTTLTVPATVRHFLSANAVLAPSGSWFENASAPKPLLKFTGSTSHPVIMEQISTSSSYAAGLIIAEQATTRPVVFQHCELITRKGRHGYHNTVSGGKVFFEDVASMRIRLNGSQKLWARQLNPESINDATVSTWPHLENFGGVFWSLGVKTEGYGTICETRDGGYTEIMGGYWRLFGNVTRWPLFKNDNSRMAATYRVSYADFTTHVSETRGTTTQTVSRSQVYTYGNGSNVTMYLGYDQPYSATPVVNLADYQFNSGSLASSDTDSNSTASAIASGGGSGYSISATAFSGRLRATTTTNNPSGAEAKLSNGQYAQFTITAANGKLLNLRTFSTGSRREGNSPDRVTVYASSDGNSFVSLINNQTVPNTSAFAPYIDGDLGSVPELQGVASVEFRIVFHGGSTGITNGRNDLDDIRVAGLLTP